MGRLLLSALLTALLAACAAPAQVQAQASDVIADHVDDARGAIAGQVIDAQVATAEVLVPATLQVQAVVQDVLPAPAVLEPAPIVSEAAALIVRWEVSSPQVYTRRYAGVVCPGGASGPTIGIGSDLGQQTPDTIARDWAEHPDVARLQTASGVVGPGACKAWKTRNADIRTSYSLARDVFAQSTLPRYTAAAARAFHDGWSSLPQPAKDANVSMGYNRGLSMVGDRNREKREIRDDCVPDADIHCNAAALRSMCRLWVDTPNGKGLCARRNDEARRAEQAA